MKAFLCDGPTTIDGLRYADIPSPTVGPGQVKIAVNAAGVNFPDTLIIQHKYQVKPPFPFSPGGEVVGEIIAVGEGVDARRVGERVVGFCTYGGYVEEIAVDQAAIFPIPESMTDAQASGFISSFGSAYHALVDRAAIRQNETVLVLGAAGAVGTAALQLCRAMGIRAIAAVSSQKKMDHCRQHGAAAVIDYTTHDLKQEIKNLTDGRGADVIVDLVGGASTDAVMSAINWGGRLLVIGFASGEIPKIALNRVLLKGCALVGSYWGGLRINDPARTAANHSALINLFERGQITPVVDSVFPLSRAVDALRRVQQRDVLGKIALLTPRGESSAR